MLRDLDGTDWKGKKVLISGAGNVAQYAALKVIELGGTVLSLSDSNGALVATGAEGFTPDDIASIATIKLARKALTAFDAGSKFKWHEGARPWTLVEKADIALPSASQNELNGDEAKALIKAGVRYVAEGSNMRPSTFLRRPERPSPRWTPPKLKWTPEQVDAKLKDIMITCYKTCWDTGKEYAAGGAIPSLVAGANIAGFIKVADAMKAQGDWW
ncbi:hypothetical protein P7C73_g5004, partial [Tremellales sp. Uapishka_1]